MQWTVLIPVRAQAPGKTRLAGASVSPAEHERLVAAIRSDTIAAARAARSVARVVRVLDAPSEADDLTLMFVQSAPGLNAALAEAAEFAAAEWPADAVLALVGDLPALQPDDLEDVLAGAALHPVSFVPDAEGTGTTLLAVHPGVRLVPKFGQGSAARHAEQAVALPAKPGLQRDVDTEDDLAQAVELGVGPATRAALAEANACT